MIVKIYNLNKTTNFIIAFIIFCLAFWGIRYTSDWEAYETFFFDSSLSRDVAFKYLANWFVRMGLEYIDLFRLHIVIIACLFAALSNILRINPIVCVLLLLLLNYVAMGNQIRFFIAWPLAVISFYYYVCKGSKTYCVILAIISVLFHFSTLILHVLLLWGYKFLINKSVRSQIFIIFFLNIFLLGSLQSFVFLKPEYGAYFGVSLTSSFMGGIYNLIYPLMVFPFIMTISKLIGDDLKDNEYYKFLYTLSIVPFVFCFLGIKYQVLVSRFILTLFPVWIALFLYIKRKKHNLSSLANCAITVIVLVFFIFRYIMPFVVGLPAEYLIEAKLMLNSYHL